MKLYISLLVAFSINSVYFPVIEIITSCLKINLISMLQFTICFSLNIKDNFGLMINLSYMKAFSFVECSVFFMRLFFAFSTHFFLVCSTGFQFNGYSLVCSHVGY